MSRVNRMQSANTNPAEKFFQWKSDHQKFAYYDKAQEKNVFVDMPVRFLAIASYKTIKGYNPKKGGIGCNEVRSVAKNSSEILKAYYFNDGKEVIAEGKWSDIKDSVDNAGGKFTESVYAMLPDGTLVNFQINGASLSTWYEFQKNQSDKFFDYWIEVNSFKEGKQGKVEYTFPVFDWGQKMDRREMDLANNCDAKITSYESTYFSNQPKNTQGREKSEVDKYEAEKTAIGESGDLEF